MWGRKNRRILNLEQEVWSLKRNVGSMETDLIATKQIRIKTKSGHCKYIKIRDIIYNILDYIDVDVNYVTEKSELVTKKGEKNDLAQE